jgi:hypothetical protein
MRFIDGVDKKRFMTQFEKTRFGGKPAYIAPDQGAWTESRPVADLKDSQPKRWVITTKHLATMLRV